MIKCEKCRNDNQEIVDLVVVGGVGKTKQFSNKDVAYVREVQLLQCPKCKTIELA